LMFCPIKQKGITVSNNGTSFFIKVVLDYFVEI
jgi:hypothetical protein